MKLTIKNHKIITSDPKFQYKQSANMSGVFKPKYLVVHFTAGRSFERSLNTLTKKRASGNVSAHLLIGRDGRVAQMVPFNRVAWHAGKSTWDGLSGLNHYSIGIELENFGLLKKRADGQWITYFNTIVPNDQVIEAAHKNRPGVQAGWHTYESEQLEALEDISEYLFDRYELKDVMGHDSIAPKRKLDPGPAFPMDKFKSLLLGRDDLIDWDLDLEGFRNW
jgi:N-acetylmuramoyl-L-alanine amidase